MSLKEIISKLQAEDRKYVNDCYLTFRVGHTAFERGVLNRLDELITKQAVSRGLSESDIGIMKNQFTNFYRLLILKNLQVGVSFHTFYRLPVLDIHEMADFRKTGFPQKTLIYLNGIASRQKKEFASYELDSFVAYINRKLKSVKIEPLTNTQIGQLLLYIYSSRIRIEESDHQDDTHFQPEFSDYMRCDEIVLKSHFLETCIEYLDKEDWRENWLETSPRHQSFIHADGTKRANLVIIRPKHINDERLSYNAAREYWLYRRKERRRRFRYECLRHDGEGTNWYIYLPSYVFRYLYPSRGPRYKYSKFIKGVGELKVATFPKRNEISLANIANYFGWLVLEKK